MSSHYLNELIDYLKLNPKQFSESLGFERVDRIYNVLKLKNGVSANLANIITNIYPAVDYNWLLTGVGEMLKNQTNVSYIAPYIGEDLINLPYVPIKAIASFVENIHSVEYDLEEYGVKPENGEDLTLGNHMIFEVEGDSMIPTIQPKSKILCEKIKPECWETAKGVVVVIYDKTLTVKRVLKNNLYMSNALTLKADNIIHGELIVERAEIRAMWQAVRVVSMKIQ